MKLEDIKKMYFACTGNTCRSPMAERIFQELSKDNKIKMKVGSRRAQISDNPKNDKAIKGEISNGTRAIIISEYGDHAFPENIFQEIFLPKNLNQQI